MKQKRKDNNSSVTRRVGIPIARQSRYWNPDPELWQECEGEKKEPKRKNGKKRPTRPICGSGGASRQIITEVWKLSSMSDFKLVTLLPYPRLSVRVTGWHAGICGVYNARHSVNNGRKCLLLFSLRVGIWSAQGDLSAIYWSVAHTLYMPSHQYRGSSALSHMPELP